MPMVRAKWPSYATALKRSKRIASRSPGSGRSLTRFGRWRASPFSCLRASSIGPSFWSSSRSETCKSIVGIDPDQMGIEGGMMDFGEWQAVRDGMGCPSPSFLSEMMCAASSSRCSGDTCFTSTAASIYRYDAASSRTPGDTPPDIRRSAEYCLLVIFGASRYRPLGEMSGGLAVESGLDHSGQSAFSRTMILIWE